MKNALVIHMWLQVYCEIKNNTHAGKSHTYYIYQVQQIQ